jgi:hypothetical protein
MVRLAWAEVLTLINNLSSFLSLALVFLMERLAESTSLIHSDAPHVRVPIWVPVLGVVTCLVLIGSALLR